VSRGGFAVQFHPLYNFESFPDTLQALSRPSNTSNSCEDAAGLESLLDQCFCKPRLSSGWQLSLLETQPLLSA
jgi:hypothetical protein